MALGVRPDGLTGRLWPPCAKGSTWVLGGRPGGLSADYYKNFATLRAGDAYPRTGRAAGFQAGRADS